MSQEPTAVPPARPVQAWREIPLDELRPSKTNPRKTFDPKALEELAASIKTKGLLQPLLVRESGGAPKGGIVFEIVAGERRYRAAKKAGLGAVPCVVRGLGDDEVLEIQITENLQREDLHPLDEAEGYEQLLKLGHGKVLTVEDLAAKVGKSKAYVYARLKLCALVPAARKVFLAGGLNPSTALLVARIPVPELQVKAAEELAENYAGEPMSARQAAAHVQENYMLRLAEAPWPVADVQLVPAAGACTTCPKRTGNQRDLFGDVKSADVCTDPTCFANKKQAWAAKLLSDAKATGREVISGKEAKAIKPHEYSECKGYVDLSSRCYDDPKGRSYQTLLGNLTQSAPLLEDPHTKELKAVMSAADVTKALKEKGYTWAGKHRVVSTSATSAADRKREEKRRLETEVRHRIHEAVRDKVTGQLSRQDLALIAASFYADIWDENRKRVMALWGWGRPSYGGSRHSGSLSAGKGPIAALKEPELRRLLVDLALVKDTYVSWNNAQPTQLLETARRHKVDVAKIRRELTAAAAAKRKAKGTKSKSASKPGARKGPGK